MLLLSAGSQTTEEPVAYYPAIGVRGDFIPSGIWSTLPAIPWQHLASPVYYAPPSVFRCGYGLLVNQTAQIVVELDRLSAGLGQVIEVLEGLQRSSGGI